MAKLNMKLLKSVAAAMNVQPGHYFVTKDEATPFQEHNPVLMIVNPDLADPTDPSKRAAKLTPEGLQMAQGSAPVGATGAVASPYQVMSGIELPKSKRGAASGGAPTVYPFDTMEVGGFFFVPVSEKHKDPVKQLGSTVSAANARFSQETGEVRTVERTKRGPKNVAMKDAAGNKIKETVEVKVKKPTRKFVIRPVQAGVAYGTWTAPANGAVVARVDLD